MTWSRSTCSTWRRSLCRPRASSPCCSTRRRSKCCCARRATPAFRCSTCTIIRRKARRWSGRWIRSGTRRASSRREACRRFCGPTVPLLRMPKRTYTADEPFEATVDLAHYGPADLADAQPVWTITDEHGREVASGTLPALNAPTGKLTPLGAINASLAKAAAPCKLTVTVALAGHRVLQRLGDLGLSRRRCRRQPPADVVVCDKWDAGQGRAGRGQEGRVLRLLRASRRNR